MKKSPSRSDKLEEIQRQTFDYFIHEVNNLNGLVADTIEKGAPASIAAVGLALSAYPVGVERGFITRSNAIKITLATLRFFRKSSQGTEVDATGYKGFYYHFLNMSTGKRAWKCELSTVDTAILLAGMLVAGAYFTGGTPAEREIRSLSEDLYDRADWQWAANSGLTVAMGWNPENGFLPYRWQGYDEALILYLLALGAPRFSLSPESYAAWTSTYNWRKVYDHEFLYSGPLFTHQISHIWTDFRGVQDYYMRTKSIDYFENSRRATYAQRQYAIDNPLGFKGYGENCWGITACLGPGPATRKIKGKNCQFFGYVGRGIPDGPDDGTLAPWGVIASLPFAPEIVLPAIDHFDTLNLRVSNTYGFKSTFNATFPGGTAKSPYWHSPFHCGLNQGPIVLMIENFRSGLLWRLMRQCPPLVRGLHRAGFAGGWLGPCPSNDRDATPARRDDFQPLGGASRR